MRRILQTKSATTVGKESLNAQSKFYKQLIPAFYSTKKNGDFLRNGVTSSFNYMKDGVNVVTNSVGSTIGSVTNIPSSIASKILDEAVGTMKILEDKIDDKHVDISISFNLGVMSVTLSKKHN